MNLVYLAIFLYALWQASPMFSAWHNTPHLYGSEWIFLIWIFPLLVIVSRDRFKSMTIPLFALAIGIALLGQLGSLKALAILSFALCLTAFLPWNRGNFIWLLTSISWMPAIGYIGRLLHPDILFILRFFTVALSSSLLFYVHRRQT